ncbi:MAG TPA: bifunctional phosphopantothenoylcysteine decarboxylase/phosphopantothenate--cysteine ligase CoaBC [Thermoanaerobaculia bacterium]|nr:bifunctional phosphopantothenoylcysteine decarboxylase/phosphopantothenate--cysteine ligase CoaBC [Thermoanaerobaculia bacterium]
MRVLLGVSGGIAAYKAAELVRRLRERNHEVRCALTRSAAAFVTPLTLEVLSGHPVYGEEYLQPSAARSRAGADPRLIGRAGPDPRFDDSIDEAHIAAARWASVLCVAPATAHLLARLALGLADDFLTTTALAFEGPLVVAPAMHSAMWRKAAVQEHLASLRRLGARVVGPVEGPLASGDVGVGRMADPELIAREVELAASGHETLAGRRVLVTAGPTQEPLDPVRFLANRSSGKMGFALAAEAARRGARVALVAGPVTLPTPAAVDRRDVATALDMERAVRELAPGSDLVVMAAAVADFRPSHPAPQKIKRAQGIPRAIELTANPDILAGVRQLAPGALLIGFAAETADLLAHAQAKLAAKDLDFLVANDVSRGDIAFGSDANEVLVLRRGGEPLFLSRRAKTDLAAGLLDLFTEALSRRERPTVIPG